MDREDTIAAIATGRGGAISVIRLSGRRAFSIADKLFRAANGRPLSEAAGGTVHFGRIVDANGDLLDEVLATVFRAPRSYTGDDLIEISCHGSAYIEKEIMRLLIAAGARSAAPGEFTLRAFLSGKMDLSQAEAVADLIASTDRGAHTLAVSQMRGGYCERLKQLRSELLELGSLLELELDFSEEDVEFADRRQLQKLMAGIMSEIDTLTASFSLGNAVKEGIPVAIAGPPNVGKSTLLNALAEEERALVSDIAGTTRDVIEESLCLEGIRYRFFDTAGIRTTEDRLEQMGIERAVESTGKARIVLLLLDASKGEPQALLRQAHELQQQLHLSDNRPVCIVLNKIDLLPAAVREQLEREMTTADLPTLFLSAKRRIGVDRLKSFLSGCVDRERLDDGAAIVSNFRHYEALLHARESLARGLEGLKAGLSSDLLAEEVRAALYQIGLVVGEVTTDEILGQIFSKFCIGK